METSRHKDLTFNDISSTFTLRKWIKEAIKYYRKYEVPKEHLLIYHSYIESNVVKNQEINTSVWMKQLDELKKRIEVL